MRNRESGFTLVEMMIVAAIVSVVAGIAVPNLLSSRATANERAVVAALRTVSTAQTQCQLRAIVDADRDGRGEALGLAEMAGLRPLRGTWPALVPPALSTSLGSVDAAGHATSHGYRLAMYLPDASGTALLAVAANDASVDADLAETAWSCLAWPLDRGRSGVAAFFVNQSGEILTAVNATYSGSSSVPPGGAALVGVAPTVIVGGAIAANTTGADGNRWMLLR